MPQIQIVTDSSASFITSLENVVVVPNRIEIGGVVYCEQTDINPEDALQEIAKHAEPPRILSPGVDDYLEVYRRLSHYNDAIISIHPSRELFPSWQNAREASQQIGGSCEIAVVDSRALCAAQGMLTHVAASGIAQGLNVDEIIRKVRGAVDRVYTVYCTDNVHFLGQSKIMSQSHTILGAMMGIKPFLTMEEGELRLIEKTRGRTQIIERLVEFATEFEAIEAITILQARPQANEQTRALQDRLTAEFPGHQFPNAVYSPALASLIGADAIGVVILEEEFEDDAYN